MFIAQDKAASDSMDPAMDLMGLNGLIRKAINLVRGVEIAITDDMFEMAVISIIPWFKVPSCKLEENPGRLDTACIEIDVGSEGLTSDRALCR